MSSNFPTSLDSYSTLVDNVDDALAAHQNDRGDAIEALEAKVGIDSSAVTTTHDYLLRNLPSQAGNWDAGAVEVRAQTFQSDQTTGTAPLIVASTTVVSNLNADMVDGLHIASLVQTSGTQTVNGVKTFGSIPVLPASNPTTANQATRKTYVDTKMSLTGDEAVAGVKTFSSFPVTPSSAPTTDYQTANKKYVDDNAGLSPNAFSVLYEDFFGNLTDSNRGTVDLWWDVDSNVDLRGGVVLNVLPNNAGIGLTLGSALQTPRKSWISSQNPILEMRIAPHNIGSAITHFVGLEDGSNPTSGPPNNGIYFKYIQGGNYHLVCRKTSSESTLDSGVAYVLDTFVTLKAIITTSSVEFFVGGTSKGTINTNIPAVSMGITTRASGSTGTNEMYLDYIFIKQDR